MWSVPASGGLVPCSDRFPPSDPSRSRSLTLARSLARAAWAQTLISVSWRREQTFTAVAPSSTPSELERDQEGRLTKQNLCRSGSGSGSKLGLNLWVPASRFTPFQESVLTKRMSISPSSGLEDEVGVGSAFRVLVARPPLPVGVGLSRTLRERLHHLCNTK